MQDIIKKEPTIDKRQNPDNQPTELITAIFYINPHLQSGNEIINQIINEKIICHEKNLIMFKNKLSKMKENDIYIYYNKLRELNTLSIINIEKVYLMGKNKIKNKEIDILNKGLDKKSIKADLYIKYNDGKIIGISVKKDSSCPLTNWSIYKIINNKVDKLILKKTLIEYLEKNKLITDTNSLFYNRDNIYFNMLGLIITKHIDIIKTHFIKSFFCNILPYDLYRFNGSIFIKEYIELKLDDIIFEECKEYYYNINKTPKSCAKMFYKMIANNYTYKIEVRWKGSFTPSPQFLTYCNNYL